MLAILGLAAAGYALTLHVFYPGYMTNDAGFVYRFMNEWSFGDWQSPLMSMIWWVVDPIAPGTGSMFLLTASLYWIAFGLLALTLARGSPWLGIAVPVLALAPPAVMLLAMIWRDVLFAGIWLLAASIAFAATSAGAWTRRVAQALAAALVALGVLLRPNAVVAAPLLLAYVAWPTGFRWKRAALLFLPALAGGYALIQITYYGIIGVTREHPERSVMVFDLGGITHFSGQNQFPVAWTPEQSALVLGCCYNPERWDSYWTMEPCKFVMQRLEAEKIFTAPELVRAWMRAIAAHPFLYLRHRATYMWTFLGEANLTLERFHIDDPAHTPLARNPAFQAVLGWHRQIERTIPFRTGFWLVLAAVACGAAWPARNTPSGALAVGLTGSAILYVATFFPIGVAAEFRYGYWCVLATLAGGAAAVAARRAVSALPGDSAAS